MNVRFQASMSFVRFGNEPKKNDAKTPPAQPAEGTQTREQLVQEQIQRSLQAEQSEARGRVGKKIKP